MKPNIERAPADLERVLVFTGFEKVVQLQPAQAAMLAPHIATHPHTYTVAASGIRAPSIGPFGPGPTVGMEWVRREPNQQASEPPLNVNRFLFGYSEDGLKCLGYEVTEKDGQKNPVPGTVFPHWPHDFEALWAQHFPDQQPHTREEGAEGG